MNVCMFTGNLVRDVELKDVGSTKVGKFSVAVSEKYKKKDGTEVKETAFLDCESWGKTAEVIEQYFKKGTPISVRCKIKQESWDDKTSGQKRTKLKFVVEEFWFTPKNAGAGKKDESGSDDTHSQNGSAELNSNGDTPF